MRLLTQKNFFIILICFSAIVFGGKPKLLRKVSFSDPLVRIGDPPLHKPHSILKDTTHTNHIEQLHSSDPDPLHVEKIHMKVSKIMNQQSMVKMIGNLLKNTKSTQSVEEYVNWFVEEELNKEEQGNK